MFERKTHDFTFDSENPLHRRNFFIFWHSLLLILLCLTLFAPIIHLTTDYSAIWPLSIIIAFALFSTSPVFKPLRKIMAVRVIEVIIVFGIECLLLISMTMRQSFDMLMLASFVLLIAIQVASLTPYIKEKPGEDKPSPPQ